MMMMVMLLRLLLCVLGCGVSPSLSKSPQDSQDAQEVTLKVHLSDATTHQPLGGATVELFANHTSVTAETSAADGNAYLRFPYRLGMPLVVTATKQGYVPNSAPWSPNRLPVFSSLSLDLLPERAATLMVYDNVVQILSGFQGSRGQPWVQFPRRALTLPPDTSYSNLTALLTVASSPAGVRHFPYLLGLAGNGTEKRFELTPVAAISVHLLAGEGVELQVNEPISISVPLPADSGLKENDHIPAWRFDPRLGAWLKSSLGSVHREGQHLSLTYIAPQLGYWVVAMSPLHPGPVVAKDISMYHTVFLLAILGGMAVILLCLLCLLLYYCRRRCLRPRGSHHKLTLSSALEGGKRDQATSMSHLNLISSEVQLELVSTATEPDSSTPMLKQPSSYEHNHHHHQHHPPGNHLLATHASKHSRSSLGDSSRHGSSLGNLTPGRRDYHRQSTDTFPCKAALASAAADRGYRQSYASVCSSAHQVSVDGGLLGLAAAASSPNGAPRSSSSPPPHSPCRGAGGSEMGAADGRPLDFPLSRSVDHLERPPAAASSRPGQLLCCGSVDLLSDGYGTRVRPTLVIPAHYMRLPGEHPLCGQALLLQTDQQSDLETLQAELNASHPQSPGQSPSPRSADDAPGGGVGGGAQDQQGGAGAGSQPPPRGEAGGLPGSMSIPAALGQAGGQLVEMNTEDTLLAEKTLMELRGGKPLPHPRAWFVSLDGRSNAHIRHSYIDLSQRAGGEGGPRRRSNNNNNTARGNKANDASLDSGVDLNEPAVGAAARGARSRGRDGDRDSGKGSKGAPTPPAYTQLVYVDDLEGGDDRDESPSSSPEDGAAVAQSGKTTNAGVAEQEVGGGGEEVPSPSSPSPTSSSSSSSSSPASPPPLPTPEGSVAYRTVPSSSGSPDEDDGGEGDKKSPWQRREERPLLSFNALK